MRRTKIVATLGPATDRPNMLERVIAAGTDVVRLNYSHDTTEQHGKRVKRVRALSSKVGRQIGIIADLQGPKIRIGGFKNGQVMLETGDDFVIDAELRLNAGDENHVGITYKNLPKDVTRGDTLLIDDGRLILQVERVAGSAVECVVLLGGLVSDNKGLNREGGGLSASALTRKDRADLRHAVKAGADYIAVSFPRNAGDITAARKLIEKENGRCGIIAKIERAEALDHVEEIFEASDGIMIARGDLGVEIGDALLAPVQKRLARVGRDMNRIVITATQMMHSMVENQNPTRAEVMDVANAVLDGSDAVMLSAETTMGKYPDKAVDAMARICLGTENGWSESIADYQFTTDFEHIDQAIAISAMYCANRIGAEAIVALTETGTTCKWMSRMGSDIPIFAFTNHVETERRVTLYRGVYPVPFDLSNITREQVNEKLVSGLLELGLVPEGARVVITKGDVFGRVGGTNTMKVVRVGDVIEKIG